MRAERESGASLAEMMVTLLLLSVVFSVLGTFYVTGIRTSANTDARNTAINAEHVAVDRLTKYLRNAVSPTTSLSSISFAGPSEIDFYSNTGTVVGASTTGPSLVQIKYVPASAALTQTITPAVASGDSNNPYTWPANGGATRTLINKMAAAPVHPVFSYFAASDVRPADAPGASTSTLTRNADSSLDIPSLARVSSIDIWLQAGAVPAYKVPDTTLFAHITLLNSGTASLDN